MVEQRFCKPRNTIQLSSTFILAINVLPILTESRAARVDTVTLALDHWGSVQNLGKKPRTRQFNEEILGTIRKHFPALEKLPLEISEQDLLLFAQRVDEFCPSRWNGMVSALRSVTDKAKILKRRKPRFRDFTPPTLQEFEIVLRECDARPRSNVGLAVRFYTLTGVRFCEARKLKWENIGSDRVNISADVSKSGRPRQIPFLPGMPNLISQLRNTSDLVFPKPHIRRALKTASIKAGIEPMSYHSLRHLFTTRCIESGVDMPTVSRWLGHNDGGALLARMYFHLIDSHSRLMAEKVKIV